MGIVAADTTLVIIQLDQGIDSNTAVTIVADTARGGIVGDDLGTVTITGVDPVEIPGVNNLVILRKDHTPASRSDQEESDQ